MKVRTGIKSGRRILSVLLVVMVLSSALCISAFAATPNTSDTGFSFTATAGSHNPMPDSAARAKNDTSAVYLYYTSGIYSKTFVRVLGGTSSTGGKNGWVNRTTVSGVGLVGYVTCKLGVKYSIHNLVNERGDSYAKLAFYSAGSSNDTITGVWSPDSAYAHVDATQ